MRKLLVAGLSSVAVALTLTACGHQADRTCCGATSTPPTSTAPDAGAGLRRNTSPSPTPTPTTEPRLPHITLPHITWPKPGSGGAE